MAVSSKLQVAPLLSPTRTCSFGMVVVKLQAKLLSSVPDNTANKENQTFLRSTTTESIDHCVRHMVEAGWVDTTATATKMCSSCRDNKTR